MEWNMEENFSMEWNMEENFSMEWNMEWKIFGMEWKKIASMEYGKIVFHSIPFHALPHTASHYPVLRFHLMGSKPG